MGIRIKKEEDALAAANAQPEAIGKEQLTTQAPGAQVQAPGATAGAEPKGSGQFTNLNKFIEANKGKSEQFAGGVAKGAEEKGTTALGTLGSEVTAAKDVFTKEATPYKSGTLSSDSSLEDIQSLGDMATVDADEEAIFNKQFESSKGKADVEAAATNIGQTTDLGGLANVVQDYYGSKGLKASTGEKAFDTLLTGRDEGAQKKFTELRDWAGKQLTPAFTNAQTDVSAAGKTALGSAKTAAADVRSAAESAGSGILTPLQEQAKATNQAAQDRISEWNRRQSEFYESNPQTPRTSYLTEGGTATAMSQATPEQIARLNALDVLRGGAGTGYVAETYNTPVFDEAAFGNAVTQAQAAQLEPSMAMALDPQGNTSQTLGQPIVSVPEVDLSMGAFQEAMKNFGQKVLIDKPAQGMTSGMDKVISNTNVLDPTGLAQYSTDALKDSASKLSTSGLKTAIKGTKKPKYNKK